MQASFFSGSSTSLFYCETVNSLLRYFCGLKIIEIGTQQPGRMRWRWSFKSSRTSAPAGVLASLDATCSTVACSGYIVASVDEEALYG